LRRCARYNRVARTGVCIAGVCIAGPQRYTLSLKCLILLNNIYKTLYKQRPQSASDTHPAPSHVYRCVSLEPSSPLTGRDVSFGGVIFGCGRHPRLGGVGPTATASVADEEDAGNLKVGERPSPRCGPTRPFPAGLSLGSQMECSRRSSGTWAPR
jgi:hypothetical protein